MSDIPFSARINKRVLLRFLWLSVVCGVASGALAGGATWYFAHRAGYQFGHDVGYSDGYRDAAVLVK